MSASGDEKKSIDVKKALQAVEVKKTEAQEQRKTGLEQGPVKPTSIEQKRDIETRVSKAKRKAGERAKQIKVKQTLSSGTVQAVTKAPEPPKPVRSALTKPRGPTFDKVIQGFYDKSKYPNKVEVEVALKKYGLAAKEQFKPKTLDQAANRALYAVTETIGGGVRWATLGLSGSLGAENRDTRAPLYQTLGAILTPSVQDMAANAMIGKALQTKAGRALIAKFNKIKGKITKPSALTPQQFKELEQISKIKDKEFWKTPEGQKLFEQLNKRVTHYIENPEAYTAGASVIPEEVYIYQTLPPKVTPDIYEQFIAKYGEKVGLSSKALLGVLSSGTIPKPDQVLKDLADYNLNKPLTKLTSKEKEKLADDLGITTENIEDIINDIPDTPPDEEPPKEIPDIIPVEIVEPDIIEEPDIEPDIEPPYEPPPDEEPPKETPPLGLSLKDKQAAKQNKLRIYAGPKGKWVVSYDGKESHTVEARGVIDALTKAERARKGKSASVIKVKRVR